MGFNSLEFIFLFLPGFWGCYYLFPPSRRNMVLALGSMVFYVIEHGATHGGSYSWQLKLC